MKKTILMLVVLAAVVGGCKKEKKMYEKIYGHYTLASYTASGVDSLSFLTDSLGSSFYFFYDDYSDYGNKCAITGGKVAIVWNWSLSKDFKKLVVNSASAYDNTTAIGPFGINRLPVWDIKDLTESLLVMKTTYNGKDYLIDLEKI
jgi:hypothetical protein